MNKYRITISNFISKAPSLIEFAQNANQAIEQAKKRSGLSRFKSWFFNAEDI